MNKISVIVPVFNEASTIAHLLDHLVDIAQHDESEQLTYEVICVDGNSTDATVEQIVQWKDKHLHLEGKHKRGLCVSHVEVLRCNQAGRAWQMNQGAQQATGDVLLFLHADTYLPLSVFEQIQQAVQQGYHWGRFDVRLSGRHWAFRVIERMISWRSRFTGIATGDQALFIRRTCFQAVGGFPQQVLMEDIELCRRLKKQLLRPFCSLHYVMTSSRRWETFGITKTVLLMWWLRWRYFMGASPEQLKRLYR